MFILSEKEIEYCQVTASKTSLEEVYLGLVYRGFLFFQVGAYEKTQWEKAIATCRKFLERKQPVTSIIVRNPQNLTLWCENEELNLILPQQNYRAQKESQSEPEINIKKVVMKYRGQEVIREVKPKIIAAPIYKHKKNLKYRGRSY